MIQDLEITILLKNKFKNKIQLKMNIDNENISSFTINKDKWIVMKVNSDE